MSEYDELDVAAVVQGRAGDERELLAVWNLAHERGTWEGILRKDPDNAVAQGALEQLPVAGPLEALAANARLVDLLTGRRWYVMRDAREAGATWSEIGQALGMTKQGAADWYRRAIAKQEQYVGDLHDTARARAVVEQAGTAGEAA